VLVEIKLLGGQDIDGIFGPKTETAVKDFQSGEGLTVDGIVGPQTWAKLPPIAATPTLRRGSTGDGVKRLQKALSQLHAQGGGVLDPGPIDGTFGPKTEASVASFQRYAGLVDDGIVGDQTWNAPIGAAGKTLEDLAGY
jgi:peptidoglycan hydrolase-like protein with peptidoglycan-binding domain